MRNIGFGVLSVVVFLVTSPLWASKGDVDYIDPKASAREILAGLDVDPEILQHIYDDVKGSVKVLSRPIWTFHRQAYLQYVPNVPKKGKVSISHPLHRKFFESRMTDFFHNAEYGRRGYEGSGLYMAPSSQNFDNQGYDYMLATEIESGVRFIDYRSGKRLSPKTQRSLREIGCSRTGTLTRLFKRPGVCRAIGVAFARALKLKFLVYSYGVSSPVGCDQVPALVMLDEANTGSVLGWIHGRHQVLKKDSKINFNLTYYSKEYGGDFNRRAGPFAKKHFFGCGNHWEDKPSNYAKEFFELDLDYPKKPEKLASCEPVPETERLASVVHEIVRF